MNEPVTTAADFVGAHLEDGALICTKCNQVMRPMTLREEYPWLNSTDDRASETKTMVGYSSPPGHNHDDNCLLRMYVCDQCGHNHKVSKRRRCPACDWVGKDSCFCHKGPKLDEWPRTND